MEDRHIANPLGKDVMLYAVFDGHNGSDIAELCKENTSHIMHQLLAEKPYDVAVCLRQAFHALDMLAAQAKKAEVGATALLCMIEPGRVWFANAGDSMGMVRYINGKNELMSYEHKVENEKERIQKLGGMVTYWDGVARINGMLNVARGVGDHYLHPFVTPEPFVRSFARKVASADDFDFILLASDGIWDVFDADELGNRFWQLRQAQLDEGLDKQEAVRKAIVGIIQLACSRGSSDNITLMYVDQD